MYKVNPDGSISCDTPEEALRLQKLILKGSPAPVAHEPHPSYSHSRFNFNRDVAPDTSFIGQFIEKLKPLNGTTVTSADMARIMGTNTTTAVGPKLRAYRNAMQGTGRSLDDILHPKLNPDGTKQWTVKLSSTEKSG